MVNKMNLKKILIMALVLIAVFSSLSMVSAGLLDLLDSQGTAEIIIDSNDTDLSGELMIIEFKNITANDNGTYNTSQFGTNEGKWNGDIKYIGIENGKANYTLSEDTQFFAVDYYIVNLTEDFGDDNENAPFFDVKLLVNGEEIESSHEQVYFDQCDVSWGGKIFNINGTALKEEQINIDLADLQESHDVVQELGLFD